MFCTKCLSAISEKDFRTIELIKSEYQKDTTPWYIGYSGGKDSSALLSLTIQALYNLPTYPRPVTAIYCDTGVENPIVTKYVYETFEMLNKECLHIGIPVNFKIVKPELEQRFFVKVIGRGYPTPTNIFRWCTKYLRINPVKKIIEANSNAVVLLGIRQDESSTRNRTIAKHRLSHYYLNQADSTTKIFAPIIDYSIKEVWTTIKFKSFPKSINHEVIGQIYKDAGAECPVFKESKGSPCGKGRFGCWTCTVVRRDKSVEKLIENGYSELQPLFDFRNWLATFRDDKRYRCGIRRNGQKGLGPITLKGRKIILKKLLALQLQTKIQIINKEEISLIKQYWALDKADNNYLDDPAAV